MYNCTGSNSAVPASLTADDPSPLQQVHDLLDPRGGKQSLKVREHNLLGPYVDGLSVLAVSGGQVSAIRQSRCVSAYTRSYYSVVFGDYLVFDEF